MLPCCQKVNICDHLSENLHNSHRHVYWKKTTKFKNYLWNYACYLKIFYQDWWGQQSAKEASNQQKLYTILLAWLWRVWKSLFHFCSLNSECVTCICLQCGRRKQNCYRFLGKTATIDKCAVSLRVISIAYLFGQSLVNILS